MLASAPAKSMFLACAILLALLPLAVQSQTVTEFVGVGSVIPKKIFEEWFYLYKTLRPDLRLSFVGADSDIGMARLISGTPYSIDFAATNDPYSAADAASTCPPQDLFQIPILGTPMVLAYNLPYGSMMDTQDKSVDNRLILDGPTAAAIFNLRITNWRDPAILRLQRPNVRALLPDAPINLILRSDPSPDTFVVQQALHDFNASDWRWGNISQTWADELMNRTLTVVTAEQWGESGMLTATTNSIAYLPYSEVASGDQYKYASLINSRGDLLDTPDLSSGIARLTFDKDTLSPSEDVNNMDASGCWPIGSMQFVIIRITRYKTATCETRRALLLFWRWAMTNPSAVERATSMGYSILPSSAVQTILSVLEAKVPCPTTGQSLMSPLAVPQHATAGFDAVLGFDMFALCFTLVMVIYYLCRDSAKISVSARGYYLILLLGSVVNYLAVVTFWLVPSTDAVCQGRLWLSCLGFSLMLGAIFCRGYQVRAIQQMAQSKSFSKKVQHALIQAAGTGGIVAVQVVILGLWNGVDRFRAVVTGVNEAERTFSWICASESPKVWWSLEIAFTLILLAFGLYVVYQTWDLKHMVKESKWISISIYNCVVVLALVAVLLGIMAPSDDGVFWVAGGATLFLTFTIMLGLFLPRVLALSSLVNMSGSGSDSNSNVKADEKHASVIGGSKAVKVAEESRVSMRDQSRFSVDSKTPRGRLHITVNAHPGDIEAPVNMASERSVASSGAAGASTFRSASTNRRSVSSSDYSGRTSKFGPGKVRSANTPRAIEDSVSEATESQETGFRSVYPQPASPLSQRMSEYTGGPAARDLPDLCSELPPITGMGGDNSV